MYTENNNKINSEEWENGLRSFYISAKQELQNGNLVNAYEYFKKSESIYGCAYCSFINGDIKEAKILLKLIKGSNPFVNWLLSLISIINEDSVYIPTYFQIRNFYEQDMNMLFFYKNNKYTNKIISNNNNLAYYNKEIYKYTARVLLYNNMDEDAILFLKKSLDIYYKDPEVHFMLGEMYQKQKKENLAKSEYIKANDVVKGYSPALIKLKSLM